MPRSGPRHSKRDKPVRRRKTKRSRAKRKNYFIAGAVNPKRKGTFTRYCDRKGFQGSSMACINFAIKHGSVMREREAVLASTFKRIAEKRRGKHVQRRA